MTDTGGRRHHMHPAMLCIFFRVCPLGDFVGIVRLCLCLPRHSYHQISFRGQNTDGSSIHPACCSRHRRPTPVPILHLELPVTFQKKDLYLHNNCTTILFAKIDQLKNGNTFGCFDPCIISRGLFIRPPAAVSSLTIPWRHRARAKNQ